VYKHANWFRAGGKGKHSAQKNYGQQDLHFWFVRRNSTLSVSCATNDSEACFPIVSHTTQGLLLRRGPTSRMSSASWK
jgi:hypothetical protein